MKKYKIFYNLIIMFLISGLLIFAYGESLEELNSKIDKYLTDKQYSEAENTIKQALGIAKKEHGGNNTEIAKLLNKLIVIYYSQHEFLKAEGAEKELLVIVKELYGPEHFEVIQSLKNLAKINELKGNYADAELYYKQASELEAKSVINLIKDSDSLRQPKVLDFIPTLYTPIPLDLAIPDNFAVMPNSLDFNLDDGIFWGERKTLEALSKLSDRNLKTIDSPVFLIRFSKGMYQVGPNQFSDENIEASSERFGFKNLKTYKASWGDFPVLVAEANRLDETKLFLAWIGLNNPYNRAVLTIEYYYPIKDNKQPSENDIQIWNNFIKQTKVLPEPEYSRVRGFDYQKGYTIVTRLNNAKFKVSVQKRKLDGKYGISLKNLSDSVSVSFNEAKEETIENVLREKKKVLMIELTITIKTVGSTNILHEQVMVTPQEVDEFQFEGKKIGGSSLGPIFQE